MGSKCLRFEQHRKKAQILFSLLKLFLKVQLRPSISLSFLIKSELKDLFHYVILSVHLHGNEVFIHKQSQ